MVVMAGIGAGVSPFLFSANGDREWFDAIGGLLALYFVATGWATVRRKAGTIGRLEILVFLLAAAAAAGTILAGAAAANAPGGSLAGYAAADYFVFGAIFALAAAADLVMILRGGVSGAARIGRHVWRICAALFIAAGAFFFGQQQVMPEFVQGSALLAVPPFAVIALMLF
jgi:hypothetical protein